MWTPKVIRQVGTAAETVTELGEAVTEIRNSLGDPRDMQTDIASLLDDAHDTLADIKTAAQVGSVCFALFGVVALVALGASVALLARNASR